MSVVEARGRGLSLAALRWPGEFDGAAELASEPFLAKGVSRRSEGLLVPEKLLFEVAGALAEAGVGAVTVTRPDYVFEASSPAVEALADTLGLHSR